MPRPIAALALAAALAATGTARADSIRCAGGIVSTGDSKLDLLGKCGPPTLVEARTDEQLRFSSTPDGREGVGRRTSVTVERWTYDFGPQRFVQHVVVAFGRVEAVERGGHGHGAPARPGAEPIPRARCGQLAFREGERTYDLLARCGEPAVRDVKVVTRFAKVTSPDGTETEAVAGTTTVERWTYDLGPRAFVRLVTLEDGRVVRVDTGGYGYSRD
jgi:hypothetical protein